MQKNNNNNFDEEFNLLRLLDKKPNKTQRKIAEELGLSLGKLNYCIKALKKKGLIKIKNFKKNDNKLHYLYLLTPKGIKTKAKLTLNYLIKNQILFRIPFISFILYFLHFTFGQIFNHLTKC